MMLVLSRKSRQAIRIGSEIVVTVLKVDRNHVRLGIEAPDAVSIVREELLRPAATISAEGFNRCQVLSAEC
jgi:carbon storage regulator